ncbi:MAG: SprT-like domain-containing protein [Chloroflexota bacterium]
MSQTITEEIYSTIEGAFNFFNERLFGGKLPPCLFTLQRTYNAAGYYHRRKFREIKGVAYTDEIALNPVHFLHYRGDMEIMQTLCHEMVHMWQVHFGKPSQRTYHNRQWANKMISIGLMPSHTGQPGGKQTGQQMSDYPMPGEKFEKAFNEWKAAGNTIRWADIEAFRNIGVMVDLNNLTADQLGVSLSPIGLVTDSAAAVTMAQQIPDFNQLLQSLSMEKKRPKSKQKFQCSVCRQNAWAKPTAHLICGDCYDDEGIIRIMSEA